MNAIRFRTSQVVHTFWFVDCLVGRKNTERVVIPDNWVEKHYNT